jgi:hypothetical protein
MNDEINGYFDDGVAAYGAMPDGYSAPTARTAQPVQNFAPPKPRTGPMVTSLMLEGLREFDLAARCALIALSRVTWLFFSKVSDGQTQSALGVLELYRSLWNLKRDVIAPGFAGHGPEYMPGMLPAAEWSTPVRNSMAYALAGATGFHDDITQVLVRMPDNMAALPAWFVQLRNVLPAADLPVIRAYVDAPLPTTGDPILFLANFVRDDLQQCMGVTASPPQPAQPPPSRSVPFRPYLPSQQVVTQLRPALAPPAPPPALPPVIEQGGGGGGAPPSRPSQPSGGVSLAVLVVLALLGWGGYLAWQDSQKQKALGEGRAEETDDE